MLTGIAGGGAESSDAPRSTEKGSGMATLPTKNLEWGFWGTVKQSGGDPHAAWDQAFPVVRAALGGSVLGALNFLDSRDGRHFADAVSNHLHEGLELSDAVRAAAQQWWPGQKHDN